MNIISRIFAPRPMPPVNQSLGPRPDCGCPCAADQVMLEQIVQQMLFLMMATFGSRDLGIGGGPGPAGRALGGGGGAGPAIGSSGPGKDPSRFQGGTALGRRLAAAARREATDGDSQGGWCSRDVRVAMEAAGIKGIPRGDAWTKAAALAKHPRFQEVRVPKSQLDRLPPGAVVVWDRGPNSRYGHVSIALGNGMEASDLLRKQAHMDTPYRVFMPV